MIENAIAVSLKEVKEGDKVQIKDETTHRTYTIEGIVETINIFTSGFMSILLSNKKDYYGPSNKVVLIECRIL